MTLVGVVAAALLHLTSGIRMARQHQQRAHVHAGHRATHVTRLHRRDHPSASALIEEAEVSMGFFSQEAVAASQRFPKIPKWQMNRLRAHHRQVLLQLGDNSVLRGAQGPPPMAASQAAAKVDGTSAAGATTGLSNLGSQYLGSVGVGTISSPANCQPADGASLAYVPPGVSQVETCHAEDQSHIWVVFDSGSTNLWVNSDMCTQSGCIEEGHDFYNHTRSQTYKKPEGGGNLSVTFGTGQLTGPKAEDDFHVGPFTVKRQSFGMIQTRMGNGLFDGILGLGLPGLAHQNMTPFFDNIIQQKTLGGTNEFAFYLSPGDPRANAIFWGGVDESVHDGPIEYFPVVGDKYWALTLKSFQIGGVELLGINGTKEKPQTPRAIVDTGTTLFSAEDALYQVISQKLPMTGSCDHVSADTHPDILFKLETTAGEERDFVFKHTEYMRTDGMGGCSPGFMRVNVGSKYPPAMILGESFLRLYFAVFDRGSGKEGEARVGLARATKGQEVERRLQDLTAGQPTYVDEDDHKL